MNLIVIVNLYKYSMENLKQSLSHSIHVIISYLFILFTFSFNLLGSCLNLPLLIGLSLVTLLVSLSLLSIPQLSFFYLMGFCYVYSKVLAYLFES